MNITVRYTLKIELGNFLWNQYPGKNSGWFIEQISSILGFEPNNNISCDWYYTKNEPFTEEEKQQLAKFIA